MRVDMTFRHLEATEPLKSHVNHKTERLKKYVGQNAEFIWICDIEADQHVAEVRVTGPHLDFFAQAKTGDLYQSIDEAVDKLEKQLRKHKEIVKDHLHRQRASG